MKHISENGLLFGEGQPNDAVSEKGCTAIDMGGYNVEESLPSLCRYAMESGDKEAFNVFVDSYRAHLEFMLPDGAWDNSIGTRAFKWTYWGSRTSDGCQEVLFHLGKQDPVFAEAALRNLDLYENAHTTVCCSAAATTTRTANTPALITPSATQRCWRARWTRALRIWSACPCPPTISAA